MPAGPIGGSWAAGSWSDLAWEVNTWQDAVALAFVLDLNTRLLVFLRDYYAEPNGDFNALMKRYLETVATGDMTGRFQQLIATATAAMG
jgi:hypothetical protein